ncbi:MAG: septum formation initiator family protein [Eubacteriales bacterium]
MQERKIINPQKIKKLPSLLLKIFVLLIVVSALIVSANNIMEYLNIREQNEVLKSKYQNKSLKIDELKYYINTEIDDEYRERMARIMGYCFPDETIYYVE